MRTFLILLLTSLISKYSILSFEFMSLQSRITEDLATRVAVLGGGIHGCSVAYYLAKKGIPSVIIEDVEIGAAASGKSGGFLARDWGYGSTVQLHEISYAMHQSLAKELNIESYRTVPTLSVNSNRKGSTCASWLDRRVSSSPMSEGTAQVTPMELTRRLFEEACRLDCKFIKGKATKVNIVEDEVVGIVVDSYGVVPVSQVVVCLGPWSGVFCEDNFGVHMPMEGIKSTSLVYNGIESIIREPFALFCDEDENDCHLELYPRPNGDLYVCGCGGSDYVKGDRLRAGGDCASALYIKEDPRRVSAAQASIKVMSSIGDKIPDVTQACMRPCPPDGLPIMGRIENVKGAFISAGHNCWGILWAPVCGLVMAELVAEGAAKVIDISPFSPSRFQVGKGQRGKKIKNSNIGEQW